MKVLTTADPEGHLQKHHQVNKLTHVDRVAPLRSFLPHGHHLPVQHPGVRQVDEELAVRPANVQDAVRVIHRGDVRSLRSYRGGEIIIITFISLDLHILVKRYIVLLMILSLTFA